MDSNILIWALIGAGVGALASLIMRQRQKSKETTSESTNNSESKSDPQSIETNNTPLSMATPLSSNSDFYTVNLYTEYQSTKGVGVAFSGGGSRSLSCTLGQLRGLKYLNQLDKVDCISAVSGGSWASSLYTYLPESINDDDFLGTTVTDPSQLTLLDHGNTATALDQFSPNNMGIAATNLGVLKMSARAVELYVEGVPADELWVRMIGEYVFQPFGLFDLNNPKFFTKSLEWFNDQIAPNNANLSVQDFYLPKAGRPELVVNFNISPQENSVNLFPMESTAKMAGILPSYPKSSINETDLGGGYIDPFGFGSKNQSGATNNTVKVVKPENRFSVHTASGLSSSAFAETLLQATKWPSEVQSIVPREYYWPVMNPSQPSQQFDFADGGNLEDTAIAALLRRKYSSIIAFVNGSTPISWDAKNEEVVLSEQIAVLFGYQPKTSTGLLDDEWLPWTRFPENYQPGDPLQKDSYATFAFDCVFNPDTFIAFTMDLYEVFKFGGSAILKMENVAVMAQPHLGVEAYTLDKILWVYNSEVEAFNTQLETEIKTEIDLGDLGAFAHFPYYETIGQLGLTTSQVNLLAHLSCWNVISDNVSGNPDGATNKAIFNSMFD